MTARRDAENRPASPLYPLRPMTRAEAQKVAAFGLDQPESIDDVDGMRAGFVVLGVMTAGLIVLGLVVVWLANVWGSRP